MSHAHEAAVAEARQGWRLEFWRRVYSERMLRLDRLFALVMERINNPKSTWDIREVRETWLRRHIQYPDLNAFCATYPQGAVTAKEYQYLARQALAAVENLHDPKLDLALFEVTA